MRWFYRFIFPILIRPWSRLLLRRRFKACQITLEQNRSGDAIHHTLPLFPADVGCDQEIFRRLRRQPFIPQNNGNGHSLFQPRLELAHRLDRRTLAAIQLNGKTQQDLPDLVPLDKRRNMGNVSVQRAPIERLKRLGGPPQLITQSHPDPLGPVIERENSFTLH
jgi:hypothetical protein